MPVNRYEEPADFQYISMPFDEIIGVGDMMQKRNDKHKAQLAEFGNINWSNLPKDQEKSYAIRQEYNKKLDDLYAKYKETGFAGAADDIQKLKRETQMRTSQFGDIGALNQSVESFKNYKKTLDERLAKQDISKQTYESLLAKSMADYQGIGEPNEYGQYSSFKGTTPAKELDLADMADKKVNGWKADASTNPALSKVEGGQKLYYVDREWVPEKDLYSYASYSLAQNPEVESHLRQKFDIEDFHNPIIQRDAAGNEYTLDSKGNPIALAPGYGDQLKKDTYNHFREVELSNAAKFAADKNAYTKIQGHFLDNKAWEMDEERKSKAQTSILAGSTTGSKIDTKQLTENKKTYTDSLNSLKASRDLATDDVVKQTLDAKIRETEGQIRLQNELSAALEKQAGYNPDAEYNKFAAELKEKGLFTVGVTKEWFQKVVKDEYNLFDLRKSMNDIKDPAERTKGIKALETANKYISAYKDKIDNASKDLTTQHEVVLGNDATYVDQFTNRIQDGINKGSVKLLNQDGTPVDWTDPFSGEAIKEGSVKIIPTKNLWGGKIAFSIKGETEKGKPIQKMVVADSDVSLMPDYLQTGSDLIDQSTASKYASTPQKSKQLRDAGMLYYGYGVLGQQVQEANLPALTPGDKITRPTPYGNLELTTKGGQGVTYYQATLNGVLISNSEGKDKFDNEESLIQALGETYHDAITNRK